MESIPILLCFLTPPLLSSLGGGQLFLMNFLLGIWLRHQFGFGGVFLPILLFVRVLTDAISIGREAEAMDSCSSCGDLGFGILRPPST
jgi:hypothetical protein